MKRRRKIKDDLLGKVRALNHFNHLIAHFLHGDENETTDENSRRGMGKDMMKGSFHYNMRIDLVIILAIFIILLLISHTYC